MAKRGRPKSVGETKTVRVPKSLYLLLQWISDARRMDTSEVMDSYFRLPIIELFLSLQCEITKRKVIEDERAKMQGKAPLPLPRIKVRLPHRFHLPPKSGKHRSTKEVWADELDAELLKKLFSYEQFEDKSLNERLDEDTRDWVQFTIHWDEPEPPEKPPGNDYGDMAELP